MDGWTELTAEKIGTKEGVNEVNRMLRLLFEHLPSDGDQTRIYQGNGVPSLAAGEGALYIRKDSGKLYQMRSSSWTEV
jgi:hypothetical protein